MNFDINDMKDKIMKGEADKTALVTEFQHYQARLVQVNERIKDMDDAITSFEARLVRLNTLPNDYEWGDVPTRIAEYTDKVAGHQASKARLEAKATDITATKDALLAAIKEVNGVA